MSAPRSTENRQPEERKGCIGWGGIFSILVILLLLSGVAIGPMPGGIRFQVQSICVQNAHVLDLALFAYANDNNTEYPRAKSSTEVFQKLMDGGYITDPSIFYLPLPGKVAPARDQKTLKPENVSWDVTSDADTKSPDTLPLVFMTGYKVTYAPGSAAVPIIKPSPQFGWVNPHPSGFDYFIRWSDVEPLEHPGIAVGYKGNNAKFLLLESGSIPNFVPPEFKPDGMPYRQLTPEGELMP